MLVSVNQKDFFKYSTEVFTVIQKDSSQSTKEKIESYLKRITQKFLK
jgi:hypothetical protein